MKASLFGAIVFALTIVTGQGLLEVGPEPIRLLIWGLALLSVSWGAKSWVRHRTTARVVRRMSDGALEPGLQKSAVEILIASR